MIHVVTLLASLLLASPAPPGAAPPALAGTLAGRVTDHLSGDALRGVSVMLAGTRFGAVTDEHGRYRIVAPAGFYRVEATLTGYVPQAFDEVEIADGETLTLDFGLDPAGGRDVDEVTRPRTDVPADRVAPAPPPPPAAVGGVSEGGAGGVRYHEPEGGDGRPGAPPHPDRSGLLTAGDVDDHLNFDYFLRYLRRALQRSSTQALPEVDLSDRVTVLVRDRAGRPVSNARVRVTAAGQRSASIDLVAGTDGRLHLYPGRDLGRGVRNATLAIRHPDGGSAHSERIDVGRAAGGRAIVVRLPGRAYLPVALDLAVVLDVTGSMGDEHRYLTDEFEAIVGRIRRRYPQVDLRFALVAYRDRGDEFVVRPYDFTSSVAEMQRRLAAQRATGGGDYPEAMDQALEAAMGLQWRGGNTARIMFLVADAPPHDGRYEAALRQAERARAAGVRIYPVAASGVADGAEYLMRTAAALTQGRHLFLTDDSGIGRPHEEPRVACFVVTPLDRHISRVIEGELSGARVEPDRQEIIRRVGRYDRGVCGDQPVTYLPEGQW